MLAFSFTISLNYLRRLVDQDMIARHTFPCRLFCMFLFILHQKGILCLSLDIINANI
jgi:hypothetical protein